ncbi:MAG: hypothetical protein ABSD20_11900 [Terriglobales bacterium]|jgi:hypothetical protein
MKRISLSLALTCALVAGSTLAAQSALAQTAATEAVPGITVPSEGIVWVLDTENGKPAPVRIEQQPVYINKHMGENLALVLAKGKATVDVSQRHAGVQLQNGPNTLLVRMYATDNSGNDTSAYLPDAFYQLIRLETHDKVRVVHELEYPRGKGKVYRYDQVVESKTMRIPGTPWLKIVPVQPLVPGEYAIEVKMPDPYTYSTAIWDFGVSGAAVQAAAK